jgi:hypothetical protein
MFILCAGFWIQGGRRRLVYLRILDLMRSQVVGTLGVIHVMFTLFCRVFGRFGKNDSPEDLILRDGGGL